MKRLKRYIFIIFLFITLFLCSDQKEYNELFNKAISNYNEKDIEGALNILLDLYEKGFDNYEINYNFGCVYFKLNKFGRSRFYFERALFYKPYDKDLFHNLNILYRGLLKNPLIGEQVIMNRRIIFLIPMNISILFSILLVIGFLIFLILSYIILNNKKTFLIFAVIFLFFALQFTAIFFFQYSEYNKKTFTVTAKSLDVHIAPDEFETTILTLPEGTTGKVTEELNEFVQIRLSDGMSGWIKKELIICSK